MCCTRVLSRRWKGGLPPLVATQNSDFTSCSWAGGLCHTAKMSCCITQQTCPLYHTACMSVVSHSRDVCYVSQQTCPAHHTADMSAVSQGRISQKIDRCLPAFHERPSTGVKELLRIYIVFRPCWRIVVQKKTPAVDPEGGQTVKVMTCNNAHVF